jgi:hypothetical protein
MCAFIADTTKCHDKAQIGMSYEEVIQLMKQLTLATSKQCDKHLNYLVRMKKIPELKSHGRVLRAQATKPMRSCICMEQQLRWHD